MRRETLYNEDASAALAASVLVYLWFYSFAWTSHYIPSSIAFLSRFKDLPTKYGFLLPDELTLKRIGDRFVVHACAYATHFVFLLIILHRFECLRIQPQDSPLTVELFRFAIFAVLLMYFFWQLLAVIATQFVLSSNMREYKRRFLMEFFHHVQKRGQAFLENPSQETYDKTAEFRRYLDLFDTLPTFSLSRHGLTAYLAIVTIMSISLAIFLNIEL